jgi:vesicle coat complex subunit
VPKLVASLVCAVAVTIGLISYGQAHRKAVYHGRSLFEWQAALFDTSAGVRDTAAYALTRLVSSSPSALAAVIRAEAMMLADENSDVREEATSALVTLHRESGYVVPTVVQVLDRSPSRDARIQAIQVLAALGSNAAEAAPSVIRALDDSSATVRLVAVAALGRVGLAAENIGVVVHASADGDADVRAAAIETLVTLNASPDTLLMVAERRAHDPDAAVRTQVAYALAATHRGELVVPRLVQAISDRDPRVRGAAALLLGRLGPAARGATPALERAASDSDREVRRVAEAALVAVRAR